MNSSQMNMINHTGELKKIYKNWKGNNYFCFKGHCYIGPEFYYGIMTNLYIQTYSWIYIVFVLMVYKFI